MQRSISLPPNNFVVDCVFLVLRANYLIAENRYGYYTCFSSNNKEVNIKNNFKFDLVTFQLLSGVFSLEITRFSIAKLR